MNKTNHQSIIIDARVKTTLEGMNEVVSKLNQGLKDGTAKIDLTKGVGSSLSKQMDKFKDEYSKFSKYIEDGKIEFADSKDAIKSGETLIKTFKEMRRVVGDFDNLTVIDAKKLFPDAFDAKVNDLLKGLNRLSSAMTKLESKQLDLTAAQTEMGELTREAQRLQRLIDQKKSLKLELDQAKSDLKHFDSEIEAIRAKAAKGITLKINTAEVAHGEAKRGIEEIETARKTRGFSQEDFSGSTARAVKFKGKTENQWTDESTKKDASEASKAEAAAALEAIRIYRQEENALKDLNAMLQARKKELDSLRESLSNINNMKASQAVKIAGGTTDEINEANAAMQFHAEATKKAAAARVRYNTAVQQAKGASDKIERTNAALEAQQAKIDKITLEIGELNKEVSADALKEAFSTAGIKGFSEEMLKNSAGIKDLRNQLNKLDQKRLTALKKALSDIGLGADKAKEYVEQLRGTLSGVKESADDIKKSASEIENLKNQVLQFFSLTNSVQLFKRAVTQAMNTVKELDATMTEAAVVTDFDIDDMWDKLPQYTAEAQKLGVSINGMYQATTLYYQQGLKNNEAMALGVETMKMAKIAGLESADATTAMTAALRGFNMELNELSATRVNDVYSQLAAVTAADVSQISTAMEKTASIAASANMEFETTAALLAQIIETTQEAPETAGTAMKTIIARFSEVKDLKNKGETKGEDDEGEAIDVNKIQTALNTVGISMKGFFDGTEGLDSILLKLAEKWVTLDFTTQRYIATMAAGSRQQSRFIAMMSDYERTMELVGEANNSAGASQKQFEKTMDSIESKLNQLKNAWDEFIMGLANNELLKGGIDLLTNFLNVANKLINALSGGNGLIKSIISLGAAWGALKLGGTILSGGLGKIGAAMGIGQNGGAGGVAGNVAKGPKISLTEYGNTKAYTQETAAIAKLKAQKQSLFTTMQQERTNMTQNMKTYSALNREILRATAQANVHAQAVVVQGANVDHLDLQNKQYLATLIQTNALTAEDLSLLSAEATSRVAAALATGGEVAAKKQLNLELTTEKNLRKGGITAIFTAIGAQMLGIAGNKAESKSLTGLIAKKWEDVKAQMARNAAMLTGIAVVAGVVAGVAMLIAGISALVDAWDAAGEANEEAIKKMDNAYSELAEQAAEAKEELEGITQGKDGLKELQRGFQGLTKGTEAWKEQLAKTNSYVLGLLNTYPQLASYIKNVNGVLTVADDGWDVVAKDAQEKLVVAQNSQLGAQLSKSEYQKQQAIETAQTEGTKRKYQYDEFIRSKEASKDAMYAGAGAVGIGGTIVGAKLGVGLGSFGGPLGALIGLGVGALAGGLLGLFGVDLAEHFAPSEDEITRQETGLNKKDYTEFAAAAAEAGLSQAGGSSKEEYYEVFKELGLEEKGYEFDEVYSNIAKLGTDFDELSLSSWGLLNAQKALTEQLANAAVEDSDIDEKFREQVATLTASRNEDSADQIQNLSENILEDDRYVTGKDNDPTDQFIQEYAALNKMTTDQVREKLANDSLSIETMATSLATNQAQENMAEEAKLLEKVLSQAVQKIEKDNKKADTLIRALSQNGVSLKQSDLAALTAAKEELNLDKKEDLTADDQKKIVDEYLKNTTGKGLDELGLSDDWEIIWQNLNVGTETLAENAKIQERLLNQEVLTSDELSADNTGGFFQQLQKYADQGKSKEGAQTVATLTDELVAGMTDEQANQFLFNLSQLDWSNAEDVDNFSKSLEDLGLQLPNTAEKIAELEGAIKDFADSTYNFSEEEKEKLVTESQALISKINDGAVAFTQEEYDLFSEAQQKNFRKVGEQWFLINDIDPQALVQDVKNKNQNRTLDTTKEDAYHTVEGLQGSETTDYQLVNVDYGTTANQNAIGDLTRVGIRYAGTMAGNVGSSVSMSDTRHVHDDGTVTGTIFNNSFYDYNPNGNYNEKGVKLSREQFVEDAINGESNALLYYYATQIQGKRGADAFSEILFGDNGKLAGQLYDWSAGFTQDQLNAFTAGAGNYWNYVATGINGLDAAQGEVDDQGGAAQYTWDAVQRRVFGTTSTDSRVFSGDIWDTLEALFRDDGFGTYISNYEYEDKVGATNVFSNESLDQLYKTIFPEGSIVDPEAQKNALKEYYDKLATDSTSGQEADYLNYYGLAPDPQELIAGANSTYAPRSQAATNVLSASLQDNGGLQLAEAYTEDLEKSNSEISKNQILVKGAALATVQWNKKMDIFSATIKDNADAFKNGRKTSQAYQAALKKITTEAKAVFGNHVTDDFVEQYKDLILQLQEGGEAGQAAFEELSKYSTAAFLNMSADSQQFQNVITAAMGGIPSDLEIGASFDATQAIENLKNLGYTAEQAIEILDKMGYTVTYETQYASNDNPGLSKTRNEKTGHVNPVQIAVGVKKDSAGSGFSGSGGGGGGGNSSKWENPYDEFYNTVEKINEELRKREKLELRYQRLLDRNAATAAELAKLTREQLASLETERTDREGLLEGRRRQMNDIMSEYSDVGEYAKYNEETGQIEINWDLLEALDGSTDEELTSRVEEFISKLEEQQDLIEEEEDAIEEINDAVWEIYEQGKDEYFDLEEQIKEAIVADRQREIDKLSEINDSINDTNSRILDSLQEQINDYRQERDNAKTEEEISDKQRRLAYLQQDASGANALEIMQLQEEIDEAQEDYTDTLIDQKISELQQQNDEAAEQRQRQIDIMQSQLDYYQESGAIWEEVSTLMEEGLDENKGLIRGYRLETLLKEEAGFEGLSKLGKMNWLNELNGNIAQALAWLKGGAVQTLFGQGGEVNFTNADGNLVTGTVNSDGDIETSDGQIYSADSFSIDSQGNVTSTETQAQAQENYQATQETEEEEQVTWNYSWPKPSTGSGILQWGSSGDRVRGLQQALKDMGYSSVGSVDGQFGQKTYNAVKQFQKDAKTWQPDIGSPDGKVGPQTRKAFATHPVYKYKTGGLADFTGPAWLDGTKSKPEYILNADQTKAFFQLVDVLSSLQAKPTQTTQNNGDNTYDIDINVESIGSDYDVEQLAETVKRLINDDARYRNNNAINLMR